MSLLGAILNPQFIAGSSYFIIFVIMVIEGPLITIITAFAASLGVFDVRIIFLLSILGNLIPDVVFFFIGKFSRGGYIEKRLRSFKLGEKRICQLENGMKNHAGKTLVIAKLTPFIPIPAILLAGFGKVPTAKFFKIVLIFNIIASTLAVLIGYYFGVVYDNVARYFKL